MAINDTIISTLNASDDMIFSIDTYNANDIHSTHAVENKFQFETCVWMKGTITGTLINAVLLKKLLYNIKTVIEALEPKNHQ